MSDKDVMGDSARNIDAVIAYREADNSAQIRARVKIWCLKLTASRGDHNVGTCTHVSTLRLRERVIDVVGAALLKLCFQLWEHVKLANLENS